MNSLIKEATETVVVDTNVTTTTTAAITKEKAIMSAAKITESMSRGIAISTKKITITFRGGVIGIKEIEEIVRIMTTLISLRSILILTTAYTTATILISLSRWWNRRQLLSCLNCTLFQGKAQLKKYHKIKNKNINSVLGKKMKSVNFLKNLEPKIFVTIDKIMTRQDTTFRSMRARTR